MIFANLIVLNVSAIISFTGAGISARFAVVHFLIFYRVTTHARRLTSDRFAGASQLRYSAVFRRSPGGFALAEHTGFLLGAIFPGPGHQFR